MNDVAAVTKTPIHETLRIGGERTDRDERIEVFNPWDNSVVGTVPVSYTHLTLPTNREV